MSVDGYSYLQDRAEQPGVADRARGRPAKTARASSVYHRGRRARAWLVSGQAVARHPAHHAALALSPGAVASATPLPSATPTEDIVAPRALPVESAPASEAHVTIAPTPEHRAGPLPPTEPEVRRAEPVHPEDLVAPNVPDAATRQSRSDHPDAEDLSARDSRRPDRTGLQWLDRSVAIRRRPFAAGT